MFDARCTENCAKLCQAAEDADCSKPPIAEQTPAGVAGVADVVAVPCPAMPARPERRFQAMKSTEV